MKITKGIVATLAFVLTVVTPVSAIEGLKLTVQCPDVVLSWPSATNETYLVQYRPTLDTNSVWTTLTNFMPATEGTNLTVFVHSNQVDCPVGQVFGMMALSGGGGGMLSAAALSSEERQQIKQVREEARLAALYQKCQLEGREPYEWELKNQPPLPPSRDEMRAKILKAKADRLAQLTSNGEPIEAASLEAGGETGANGGTAPNGPQPENGSGGSGVAPSCGFYRVVRNGLHLGGVQSGMVLSGTVDLPYEFGVTNSGNPIVQLFANGVALPQVTRRIDAKGQQVLRWNTAFSMNGTYEIYALCDFDDIPVYSLTNTVILTNLVHFNEFMTDFGDQMWVYAELAIPEAEVFIDMYTGDGYLGTFYDSTTNGVISFTWNLVGPNSQLLTNETFHGVVNVNSQGSGQQNTNPPPWMTNAAHIKWNKQYGWFSDNFVVAWGAQPPFGLPTFREDIVQEAIVDILANPAADYPYTLSPGNTYNGNCFKLTPASRTNLLNYLAEEQYRNFIYYGHGHSSAFGDLDPTVSSAPEWLVTIEEEDIRQALGNFQGQPYQHPYRFVFLHSCNSAAGTLHDAFGIKKRFVHRSWYQIAGIKARAFVGFVEKFDAPANPLQVAGCKAMMGQLFAEWRDGANLDGIIQRAKQHAVFPLPSSAGIIGATNLYRFYPY